MECRVTLVQSEEGFSVSRPALRGCHSQGSREEEALENIKAAIREWIEVEAVGNPAFSVTERTVTV